ncbi:MAG: beta-galactosidase [Clostridiaceae bacterium]|nr:beta-galactosidase [Clostridiaceae bacterium]
MKPDAREIFGAEIQYFRIEPQYWELILRRFAETGLRTVTTYVQWGTHMVAPPDAAHPAGVLDFTGETNPKLNLMRFLALVEQYGLNLNFRCGPFCCNEMPYGGYPCFMVMDDPDMFCLDYQNRATKGYWIGKPEGSQLSYLHPRHLDWCRKWLCEVDRIIVPHLKCNGGCITMVNLDNEISYIVQDSFLASDYNPVNVAPGGFYHQFLRETYGTPVNLPYRTKYAAFKDVPAPRAVPDAIDDDFAYYADWVRFKTWVMCRYIEALRGIHEENGVTADRVLFMTNFNPHLPEGVPTRMPDFERATGGVVGYDFYRGTFMSYSGYQSMARVLKLMNHTTDFTFSAEFMAGTWNKVLSGRVSDDHMRFMARCAFAHGCKAIDWFMFHDRDCWNDAPVSSHGQKRPSYDVLAETPELLFHKITHWNALTALCDLAIVYDLTAHLHTAIGDPMPCADNDLYIGKPSVAGTLAGISSREYLGLFRLAEQNGTQAAAVDIQFDDRALYAFPLAVYPGSPVISRDTENALSRYAASGKTLAITGVLPSRYESGEPCSFLGGLHEGVQSYGAGRVVVVGRMLGQAASEEDSLEDIAAFGRLMDDAGVVPAVRMGILKPAEWVDWGAPGGGHRLYTQPRLLGSAVLQRAEGETILFLLNHYPEAHRFSLRFSIPCHKLVCLTEECDIDVSDGYAEVELDRKNCQIYRVV